MASRSGGTPIRTGKVKPGPDQAFTLPKGTSAAPIKQVVLGSKFNTKALNKKLTKATKKSTVKKDAAVAAAIAVPTAAYLAKDELKADFKKGWKKGTETLKKIFKKPKSDLGSPGDRKGYPHE